MPYSSRVSIAGGHAPQRLELPDADVLLWERALDLEEAGSWFELLRTEIPWRQDEITLFGRTHPLPRLQSWHGEPGTGYTYSGMRLEAAPWTPMLRLARARVEALAGEAFDSVLANLYRDGHDQIGWHADDEASLGERPLIASLSLGAARRFRLRHRAGRAEPVTLELAPGSLLVMAGDTQRCWQHTLPRTARAVGERINLTFRRMLDATRSRASST